MRGIEFHDRGQEPLWACQLPPKCILAVKRWAPTIFLASRTFPWLARDRPVPGLTMRPFAAQGVVLVYLDNYVRLTHPRKPLPCT